MPTTFRLVCQLRSITQTYACMRWLSGPWQRLLGILWTTTTTTSTEKSFPLRWLNDWGPFLPSQLANVPQGWSKSASEWLCLGANIWAISQYKSLWLAPALAPAYDRSANGMKKRREPECIMATGCMFLKWLISLWVLAFLIHKSWVPVLADLPVVWLMELRGFDSVIVDKKIWKHQIFRGMWFFLVVFFVASVSLSTGSLEETAAPKLDRIQHLTEGYCNRSNMCCYTWIWLWGLLAGGLSAFPFNTVAVVVVVVFRAHSRHIYLIMTCAVPKGGRVYTTWKEMRQNGGIKRGSWQRWRAAPPCDYWLVLAVNCISFWVACRGSRSPPWPRATWIMGATENNQIHL